MKNYTCNLYDVIFSVYETPAGSCELVELPIYVSFAKEMFFSYFSFLFISLPDILFMF